MTSYRAKWVLPIAGEPIEGGMIDVDGDRIAAVGGDRTRRDGAVRDLGECVLLPGFVNAHTHLELTCYRGRVPAGSLWEWLERLMRLRTSPGAAAAERLAIVDGAAASMAAGVTCVGDISRTGANVEALLASPLRTVCFLEIISGAAAPPNDVASLASMLDAASQQIEPHRHIVGVSPHAIYTVAWEDLVGTGRLAAEHGVPLTLHLLETEEEARWLRDGTGPLLAFLSKYNLPTATEPPRGPAIDRLNRAGLPLRSSLLAHVNYLSNADLSDLIAAESSVVWCPRSHRFFDHAPHRWRDMLAAGVNVCVGTDSLASNETLSILDELRCLRRGFPDVPPAMLLDMGTRRGAIGLGLKADIGSLEVGKLADFVTVPWDAAGSPDPIQNLLDGDQAVREVWIGGQLVFAAPR